MGQRVALITGAGKGIGAAIARCLAADGHHVVVNDVRAKAAGELAASLGGEAAVFDVADSAAVDEAVDAVVAEHGHLDVVVNNAGMLGLTDEVLGRAGTNMMAQATGDPIEPIGVVSSMSDEAWDRMLRVHLYGTFYVTRAALRHMEPARSGAIVNMASIYGLEGNALDPAYAVAKGGIVQLTRSVGAEVAPFGIRVNAVAPGFIDTDLMGAVPEIMVDVVVGQTPAGRMGTVDEVADAVAFLASDRASFCNGEVLTVSGGWAGA
jgi:3-oxoacyl-[acyl-carrier protein] reductase